MSQANSNAIFPHLLVRLAISILTLLSLNNNLHTTARPEYRDRIPNGRITGGLQSNAFGHTNPVTTISGQAVSAFGRDFRDNLHAWTTTMCQTDSDGDGFSNGVELGDPDCTFTITKVAQEFKSDPTDPDSTPENPGSLGVNVYNEQLVVYSHGALMMLSWGILIPIAVILPLTQKMRGPEWFNRHKGLGITAVLLTFISFFVISFFGAGFDFSSPQNFSTVIQENIHAKCGIAVVVAAVVQLFNGILRPHFDRYDTVNVETKSWPRAIWEIFHITIGRLAIPVSVYAMVTGLRLGVNEVEESGYYNIVSYFFYGFYALLWIGAFIVSFCNWRDLSRLHKRFDRLVGEEKVGKGRAFWEVLNMKVKKGDDDDVDENGGEKRKEDANTKDVEGIAAEDESIVQHDVTSQLTDNAVAPLVEHDTKVLDSNDQDHVRHRRMISL